MSGKSPLWVAKQHGHSISTMLGVYSAWCDGAVPADIKAIRRAMASRPDANAEAARALEAVSFGTGFGTGHHRKRAKCSKRIGKYWRGERDSKASNFANQQVTDA